MRTIPALILAGIVCALLIASGCTGSAPAATPSPAATTAAPAATVTTLPATTPEALSWTGTWNSTWLERDGNVTVSVLTLTQAGPDVTGTYSFAYPGEGPYTGSLNATATGSTLTGTYSESDDDLGLFVFELSGDNNAFTGRWVHAVSGKEGLANSTLYWNGVRD